MAAKGDIKVLVIDDSARNRLTLTSMLAGLPGIRVVGRAGDGDEGLQLVFAHEPDVITLDLEMPRMDGYTFLRILMSRRPTPVIVISSHARRENVFRALELGALDFIAKPVPSMDPQGREPDLRPLAAELVDKIVLFSKLEVVPLVAPAPAPPAPLAAPAGGRRVVCIGASTGGPAAIKQLMAALPAGLPAALLISVHMPPLFTAAFADRLARGSALGAREARSGDLVEAGVALVAPGTGSLLVERAPDGKLRVRIEERAPGAGYVPSIDRMMESAAAAAGPDVLGIVLTGMGDDGTRGLAEIKRAGGATIAEAAATAVIFGMPEAAIRSGAVDEVAPLPGIAAAIRRFAGG